VAVDTVIVTGVTASGCIGNSLVLLAWTTLFDFAAELYGRHHGGGVLKLEIGEARTTACRRRDWARGERSAVPDRCARSRAAGTGARLEAGR